MEPPLAAVGQLVDERPPESARMPVVVQDVFILGAEACVHLNLCLGEADDARSGTTPPTAGAARWAERFATLREDPVG